MISKYFKTTFSIYIFLIFSLSFSHAEQVKSIEINGNDRISDDTIIMFSDFQKGSEIISENDINTILKNIYESNFFSDVKVNFVKNTLVINVKEFPIIENILFEGIKADKIKEKVFKNLILKSRSSFNEIFLRQDKLKIENNLKEQGYLFSKVDFILKQLDDNKVELKYIVELGEKAKIQKISFIGNKVFKDRKLKRIIISEEYKFWKFISGKKYLNRDLIEFDSRLLKNFYLNQGYYDVKINSSFARLIDSSNFELIYNIDANEIHYFNNLILNLPSDFDKSNFIKLENVFNELKGKRYSINKIEDILEEIDKITLQEQFETISASVDEEIINNKINLNFKIFKDVNLFVEKINIFGNNITRENVIRNQLEIDEGDPYNKLLETKSLNNLKNLRFFKNVKSEVVDGTQPDTKIINLTVEEKPTGEIAAGAGFGTDGANFLFSVKENNYLGKGIKIANTVLVSNESVKGTFSVNNPNYNNSDKQVNLSFQASETDRLTNFGYKTNKTGFSVGTNFEYYDDLFLGAGTSNFYERIETNSSASTRQKKQEGDYWDSFLNITLNYDKRNQKFQTTEGFQSKYFINIPIISDTNTLSNTYTYKYFTELYKDNVSSFSIYLSSADSLSNDDVKLSERIFLPSKRLRGFERGKIGPKDGNDFIGGNYATALNFSSTIPQLLENSQNIDFLFFVDAANLWGVDYDSSLDTNKKIRSSIGVGIDWLTAIGPMSFTFAETISKADTDIAESFSFNIGTTF